MANGRNRNQGGKVDQVEYGVTEQTTAQIQQQAAVSVTRAKVLSAGETVTQPGIYVSQGVTADPSGEVAFNLTDDGTPEGLPIFSVVDYVSASANNVSFLMNISWAVLGATVTVRCISYQVLSGNLTQSNRPNVNVTLMVAGSLA